MLGIAAGAKLHPGPQLGHDLDLLSALETPAVRFFLDWSRIEAELGSGRYDFAGTDELIAGLEARKIEYLLGIGQRGDGQLYDAAHLDAIEAFARASADRYQGLGWEGPNEPFFTKVDPHPTAARYVECQRRVYRGVKASQPTALVGTGGIIGAVGHLDEVYAALAGDSSGCFDFVCWHPYTRLGPKPCSPTESVKQMHGGFYSMRQARHTMVANHDAAKQIWVTEYGTNSGGPGAWGEATQALDLRDAVTRFRRHAWAGPFFAFTGWDSRDPAAKDKGDFMGMLNADDSDKLAAATFRELALAA